MSRKRAALVVAAVLASAVAVAGAALAGQDHQADDGSGYTPQQATQATSAALRATGGGRANAVERDDEDGATWEVEVTKPDGSTVDVRLDEAYRVVVVESDSEELDGSAD